MVVVLPFPSETFHSARDFVPRSATFAKTFQNFFARKSGAPKAPERNVRRTAKQHKEIPFPGLVGKSHLKLLSLTPMAPKKGSKIFHNPETKETKLFTEDPSHPWVKGRAPWDRKPQTPDHISKRAESMMRRVREKGPTEAELMGYEKTSKTRKEKGIRHTPEICRQISEKLTGRKQEWIENKSRASCRRGGCDTIYVLKITTADGFVFGKWGSTKEVSFRFREKEFQRKGFTFELLFWGFFGETTEDAEAFLGRRLSKHPVEVPHFFGHTETFEWSENTQKIVEETINALEESAPSQGDW